MEETVQQRIASHERHRLGVDEAASALIGIADDLGISLVDVIATMEQHIVQNTKVGDATGTTVPEGGSDTLSTQRGVSKSGGVDKHTTTTSATAALAFARNAARPSDASEMATKSSSSLVEKWEAVQARLAEPRTVRYECVAEGCPGHTGAYADEDCP